MKPFECVGKGDMNGTEAALKSSLFCNTGYNPRYRPVKYQQDRLAMYIGAEVINVERVSKRSSRFAEDNTNILFADAS